MSSSQNPEETEQNISVVETGHSYWTADASRVNSTMSQASDIERALSESGQITNVQKEVPVSETVLPPAENDMNDEDKEMDIDVGGTSDELTFFESPAKVSDTLKLLKAQREERKYCDVVFKSNENEVYAHSCILAANSPYFENQLAKSAFNFQKPQTLTFPIDNMNIGKCFLDYMYTARIGINTETVREVLSVAHLLGMTDVVTYCGEFLAKNLNINNWLQFKSLATQYQMKSVISASKSFLANHLPEIMCTDVYLELCKDSIIHILKECNSKNSKRLEAKVLNAILTWTCHKYEDRKDVYEELLTVLRPDLLNAKSVPAMLGLARFEDTDIATNVVSVALVNKVSQAREKEIDEPVEVDIGDEDNYEAVDDNDDEYKPSSQNKKRSRKLLAPQRDSQGGWFYPRINKRGRPRKGESQTFGGRPRGRAKKRASEYAPVLGTANAVKVEKREDPGINVDGTEPKDVSVFSNWSLTTSDMDINLVTNHPNGTSPGEMIASLSPSKKREILKCSMEDCTYETLYQKRLDHHKEWHSGVRQHVCPICGDAFTNEKHLSRHSKLHTGHGKKYDCQWCPYSSLRSDKLRDHIKNRHQQVALKLGLYEKGARGKHTNYMLDQSQVVEENENCKVENERSKEEEKSDDSPDAEADLDPEKVKQLALYGIVPKKPRKLDFSSMSRRSRTKRLVGKNDGIPAAPLLEGVQASPKKPRGRPPTVQTGEKIACPKCPKEFTTVNQMKHHLRGHGSDQPMLCEICGFTTKHYCAMKLHMNVHAGDVLKCTWEGCNYQTARRPLMRDHINRHCGIKNHVCSVCGKAFTARKHMQRHEKTHAEFKPIACTVCEFRTTRNDKLKEHLRVHHVEQAVAMGYMTEAEMQKKLEKKMALEANKPHACTQCVFRTTSEPKLIDHLKRKHHEFAISTGMLSEQEWEQIQNGGVCDKEKKVPKKKRKETIAGESLDIQTVGKPQDPMTEQIRAPEQLTLASSNYIVPEGLLHEHQLQRQPLHKDEAPSPVPRNLHVGIQSPPQRSMESRSPAQFIQTTQTSQAVAHVQVPTPHQVQSAHHAIYAPSTAQVVAISQNHSINQPHHAHIPGAGGTTTQVVTHHQPGTDLVPPYIASVMIEGVLPPEMQAQLQTHWPYQ